MVGSGLTEFTEDSQLRITESLGVQAVSSLLLGIGQ